MAANDYQFVTEWIVRGTVQEISDLLGDAPALARWWPSVYLKVEVLEPGDAKGSAVSCGCTPEGGCPTRSTGSSEWWKTAAPHGFTIEAWGDFVGRGVFERRRANGAS